MVCFGRKQALVAVVVLAGCSGGDGGGISSGPPPSPPPPPVPAAMISVSDSTPFEGDGIVLTWSSTGAKSCSATGAWSGSLETSGSRTEAVRGTGTIVYGLTCTGDGGSVNAEARIEARERPYFLEVENALHVVYRDDATAGIIAVPVDVNSDGRDDVVIHYFGGHFGQTVGDVPCANTMRVFVQQSDNTFSDETSTYLPGGTDLAGGCSRKRRVTDLNGDGKQDIVYALNREDGRQNASIEDQSTQMGAFISSGDHYKLEAFGPSNWYHSITTGVLPDGRAFAAGAGFGDAVAGPYSFDTGGNAIPEDVSLPALSPNTAEFASLGDDPGGPSNVLIQTGLYPALLGVEAYLRDTSGNWNLLGEIDNPYPVVATVDFYTYTGDGPNPVPVHYVGDGRYIVGAGSGNAISESCRIDLPDRNGAVVVMKMDTSFITDFIPGATTVVYQGDETHESDVTPGLKLFAVEASSNSLEAVPIEIVDEQREVNANFIACEDVNNDGKSDITVYPYTVDGRPDVYLGDGTGRFTFIGLSVFPEISEAWGSNVTSLLHDFDGDGIADLLIWPSTTIYTDLTYRYFKGMKPLEATPS